MRRFTVWKDDGAGGVIPVVIEKDLPDLVPQVGIFFSVDDQTIMDAVPTEKVSPMERRFSMALIMSYGRGLSQRPWPRGN